ncbi:MAG: hypothetical protein ACJA1X_002048 [Bermanella sp.]|jgi:hypothetical protein
MVEITLKDMFINAEPSGKKSINKIPISIPMILADVNPNVEIDHFLNLAISIAKTEATAIEEKNNV